MVKVSDYIADRLKNFYGVENVFMITGGGAMHLNNGIGAKIPYISNHHEQASAIAAEGYARSSGKLAVVNVTTGPGGINCLNGVFGQWTDSVPVLYISGQVKFATTLASCPDLPLRQLGDQEVDIITSVRHLTKYAAMVTDPREIQYHLDRAVYEATHGRFGPVWLDIPMNVQTARIDEAGLKKFSPPPEPVYDLKIAEVAERLLSAKRPLIVAGHGMRLAGQVENLAKFSEISDVPIATTFNGYDVLPTGDKNAAGRIGTAGQRAANFILQNADCALFLGTRNNVRQVSYNWENFAKKAFKIAVDIDPAELQKPLVKPDLAVNADLREFFPALAERLGAFRAGGEWTQYCRRMRSKYAFENVPEYRQKAGAPVNVYNLTRTLTSIADPDDIFVVANGSPCICTCQCAVTKKGQRMFLNSGDASMGYDLPAAIGAAVANPGKKVICYTGDGSIMMNLQELQTIKTHNLPIRIFIIRNDGYSSIKQTHKNFFNARYVGCNAASGVETPDFREVAKAFGIESERIETGDGLADRLKAALERRGPFVCEIVCQDDYMFSPKLSAKQMPDGSIISPSLEDMFPFLDREEFESNMLK